MAWEDSLINIGKGRVGNQEKLQFREIKKDLGINGLFEDLAFTWQISTVYSIYQSLLIVI